MASLGFEFYLFSLIESSNVGSSLHLQIQRKGRTLQSTVKLDSLPVSLGNNFLE